MKLSSTYSYSRLAFDRQNPIHLMVSAQAPKLDISNRVPLNLIVALDVSPSMQGDKLDYAKKSARKLVEHLTGDDRLGIILFDHSVRVLFEPMKMSAENKAKATSQISGINIIGYGTNIWSTLHEGFTLSSSLDAGQVRFIFLTDGQPTTGETNKDVLLKFAKTKCGENVAITTFGYGADHDPEFLASLSTDNRGNYAFIQNPDDALTAFGRELGGLLSCHAQNLKFTITPKEGVKIVKVLSDVDVEQVGEGVEITVADLYSEELRNLVLKVDVPKQRVAMPRPVTLVDVNVSYVDTISGEKKTLSIKSKVSFVKAKEADKKPNKEVMAQVTLCDLMEAQKEAVKLAKGGNFQGASSVLRSVNLDYADVGTAAYYTSAMNIVSDSASYNVGSYMMNATAAGFKSGKYSGASPTLSTSNSVQDAVANSFANTTTTGITASAGTIALGGVGISNSTVTVADGPLDADKSTTATLSKKKSKRGW